MSRRQQERGNNGMQAMQNNNGMQAGAQVNNSGMQAMQNMSSYGIGSDYQKNFDETIDPNTGYKMGLFHKLAGLLDLKVVLGGNGPNKKPTIFGLDVNFDVQAEYSISHLILIFLDTIFYGNPKVKDDHVRVVLVALEALDSLLCQSRFGVDIVEFNVILSDPLIYPQVVRKVNDMRKAVIREHGQELRTHIPRGEGYKRADAMDSDPFPGGKGAGAAANKTQREVDMKDLSENLIFGDQASIYHDARDIPDMD